MVKKFRKIDYFVRRKKRSKEIGKWFTDEVISHNFRKSYRDYLTAISNKNYKKAYFILGGLVYDFIGLYKVKGSKKSALGKVFHQNIKKYGYVDTTRWLNYGITGRIHRRYLVEQKKKEIQKKLKEKNVRKVELK